MGDMNTHKELWRGEITNTRGRDMESIVVKLWLNVINDGQATHPSGTVVLQYRNWQWMHMCSLIDAEVVIIFLSS